MPVQHPVLIKANPTHPHVSASRLSMLRPRHPCVGVRSRPWDRSQPWDCSAALNFAPHGAASAGLLRGPAESLSLDARDCAAVPTIRVSEAWPCPPPITYLR